MRRPWHLLQYRNVVRLRLQLQELMSSPAVPQQLCLQMVLPQMHRTPLLLLLVLLPLPTPLLLTLLHPLQMKKPLTPQLLPLLRRMRTCHLTTALWQEWPVVCFLPAQPCCCTAGCCWQACSTCSSTRPCWAGPVDCCTCWCSLPTAWRPTCPRRSTPSTCGVSTRRLAPWPSVRPRPTATEHVSGAHMVAAIPATTFSINSKPAVGAGGPLCAAVAVSCCCFCYCVLCFAVHLLEPCRSHLSHTHPHSCPR